MPEVLSLKIFRHNRSDPVNMKKSKLITVAKRGLPLVLAIYFLPWITLFYVICGLLDLKQVHRERRVVVDSRAARFHRR